MLVWLVPIGLFWTFAALYLGGLRLEFQGGSGPRQVFGLLATFAIFLAISYALRRVFGGLGVLPGQVLLPTLLAILSLPLSSRLGFGLFGTKIRAAGAAH